MRWKAPIVKAMVFPVVIYGCESWAIKKAECWRIDAFELWCWRRPLESPLDRKEVKPVNPKGHHSWIFFVGTDVEAVAPRLWPPDARSLLTGKDWRQKKGMTEDEMVGWHQWLDGHEFEQAPAVGDGQGSVLQSMGSQRVGHDWVTELNWTDTF